MNKNCKSKTNTFQTKFKVTVVGCGSVGATAAYSILIDGTPTELALIDVNKARAEGLLLDFSHALSFFPTTKIAASDNYAISKDSDLVVVTAGLPQKEGETRLDLVHKNSKIFEEIIPKIAKASPNAILLIVANPVDVLTYKAIKLSGFPENRVFGSGTMLDTARLRYHISEKTCVNPRSVDAFVLGEHGDSSFPVYSSATIGGIPLFDYPTFTEKDGQECFTDTKNAAYKIIHDLGFTCYSIAMVIREIMSHIFQNSQTIVPLSVKVKNYYGESDVCLSVPCILDSSGISKILEVPLNKKEQKLFKNSANIIRGYLK